MMFIFCSVRIPTSYGILMTMVDVGKYILSSENNFRRQLLLDFVVHRPEIFKNAGFDANRVTKGFPLIPVCGSVLESRPVI